MPGLRDTLDFRLLYTPDQSAFESSKCFPRPSCKHNGIVAAHDPVTDYSNQRYVLALKLAGFKPLAPTPLRLLELQGGYYARGFTADAELRGEPLRRRLFFGLGLNVGELLFPRPHGWFQKERDQGSSICRFRIRPFTRSKVRPRLDCLEPAEMLQPEPEARVRFGFKAHTTAIRRSGLSLACALPCLRQVDPCSRQGLFPAFLGRELAREISDYSHFRGRVEPHFVTKTINSCLARNIRESSSTSNWLQRSEPRL